MIDLLLSTGSFALIWLLTWLFCLAVMTLAWWPLGKILRRWHPRVAANLLLILLACPFLLSLISAVLLFAPGTEAALVSAHCHDNCLAHSPRFDRLWLAAGGLGLVLLIATAMLRQVAGNLRAATSLNTRLALLATPGDGYHVLDDGKPFVFTLGWFKSRVYLTRGLLQQCTRQQLDIVLAHEQAHVRRHDNIRQLLARLFLLPLPARLRRGLLADLHLMIESACDFDAARQYGHTEVAEALLHIQKLMPSQYQLHNANISSAFTGAEVEQRILALLASPGDSQWQRWCLQLAVLSLLVGSFGLVDPLHHGIELLMGLH